MKMLIKLAKAKKGIEIGTFTGYSALCMAEALPDDGKLYTIEKEPFYADMALQYWHEARVDHKIRPKLGLALEVLEYLATDPEELQSFDFAFVDGNKSLYQQYIDKLLPLMKSGGFIMIDNTLWMGKVVNEHDRVCDVETKVIYDTVANALNDPRLDTHTLNISDGLTIIKVR